jgi:membrane associated rhomboid family serine protease
VSFSFDSFAGTGNTFTLRGDHSPIVLDDDGISHPRSPRRARQIHTRYRDITHIAVSAHAFWLGARRSVYLLPCGIFDQQDGPERLKDALRVRIRSLSDGATRLDEMDQLSLLSEHAAPPRATQTLTLLCFLIYAIQLRVGLPVILAGHFSPTLVADGDVWRVLTASLIHMQGGFGGYLHIGLNLLALTALSYLVERPLGLVRTGCVIGFSAIGAVLADGLFGSAMMFGASGIVFGMAGSALWLDYRHADELPAWWRFPRRGLGIITVVFLVLGFANPMVSVAAHVGGLISGVIATACVGQRIIARPTFWIQAVFGALMCATLLSIGTAGLDVFAGENSIARYAARKAALPAIPTAELNDYAWMIAISPNVAQEELEAALLLAERAAAQSGRSEPMILDTLAEVQFGIGMDAEAISTIDEAIALDPNEVYYREQRKRFTGERARGDRPEYAPPTLRDPKRLPPPAEVDREELGLRV